MNLGKLSDYWVIQKKGRKLEKHNSDKNPEKKFGVRKRIPIFSKIAQFSRNEVVHRPRSERSAVTVKQLEKSIFDALKKAFEKNGLDIKNARHHTVLLIALALAQYGAPLGRPKKWTSEKLKQLRADFQTEKRKHPKRSEERICKELAMGEKYSGFSAGSLLRMLQEAKNTSA